MTEKTQKTDMPIEFWEDTYFVHLAWAGNFKVKESFNEIMKVINKDHFILHDIYGSPLFFRGSSVVGVYADYVPDK